MRGLWVEATVAMVVMAMPAAGASASRPGLSWCSESSIDDLRVDITQKKELGMIEVLVNTSYELDIVDEVWVRKQAPCEGITQPEVVHLDGDVARLVLQDDGEISLFWRPPDTLPLFQEVGEFCITASRDSPEGPWTNFLAKFCYPIALLQKEKDAHSCSSITCVRKCCPQGQAMARGAMCATVEEGENWHPSLASGEPGAAATTVHMLYGPPRLCENALVHHKFSILPSGMLKLGEMSANVNGYCIDSFEGRLNESVAMVCHEKASAWHCEWKYLVLKPALLGVSCVCLVFTWLIYMSVADLRTSNEGGCIISLVGSLFITCVTLIILNISAEESAFFSCVVAGRLCHLSTLAAFFWMNVLSFHTFMQLKSRQDPAWEKPLVFRVYSLYAWCCPLVLVLVGVVLDAIEADVIRPHIDTSCWFYDASAYWVYLYGPMLLLLLVNTSFFVGCIVFLCCGRGRHTYELSSTASQQSSGAWACVRLLIIMGILWLMEVASWSFASYCSIPEWIFDVVNCLQGVYIFLVAVCFRRNLKVFHCGCPRLVQRGRHREMTPSGSGEASELAANPLVGHA